MSFICYDDQPSRRGGGPIPIEKLDPVKGYLTHYANSLYLGFMLRNGTTFEKMQASKELAIADRKLKWWSQHPAFELADVLPGIDKLKKQWSK